MGEAFPLMGCRLKFALQVHVAANIVEKWIMSVVKPNQFLCPLSLSINTVLLANSLEYPERIQRGLEWTQFLKRLSVLCVLVTNLLFFCTIKYYSAVQYSMVT